MARLGDLFSQKIQEQLKTRAGGHGSGQSTQPVADVRVPDEKEIREALTRQKEMLSGKKETDFAGDDFDFLLAGNTPKSKEEKEKEVSYGGVDGGYVGFVNVDSFSPDPSLTNEENYAIIQAIEMISKSRNQDEIFHAANRIEVIGDKALEIVFREVYMFDFKDKEDRLKLDVLVQLCSRLTILSLKGRILIIGILQYAKNDQHIELAMRVAGQVNEKEATAAILHHAKNPNLFLPALESTLQMGDARAASELIKMMDLVVLPRNVVEEAVQAARNFYKVSDNIIPYLFERYVSTGNRAYRPIYANAIRSFHTRAVPYLFEIIEFQSNPLEIREAAKLLGSIKEPIAVKQLKEAYKKFQPKRSAIMEGIGHTGEETLSSFVAEELQEAGNKKLKEACLLTLASIGTEAQIPSIKPFVEDQEARLAAIFTLTRLGDRAAFELYTDLLTGGTDEEQHRLRGYAALLPFKYLMRIAEKMEKLADAKAVSLLLALQRPNILPREIGPVLEAMLRKNPGAPVRLEIYRLIAKFVNTKREILSQQILFQARQKEHDPLMRRELEQIFKTMPMRGGGVGHEGRGER